MPDCCQVHPGTEDVGGIDASLGHAFNTFSESVTETVALWMSGCRLWEQREKEDLVAFEVFDKRMTPRDTEPSVTIQKRGIFSISRAAHKLIGDASSVELLYDPDREIIAMRPSNASHAYTLRAQSSRAMGQMILSATAFTQYYKIDTSVSRRWKPYEEDGMLCIDLRSHGIEIVGNRTKREDAEPEEGVTQTE